MICSKCGKKILDDDFPAMVDHMYDKHNAKTDDQAKHMAVIYFMPEKLKKPNL